MICARANDGLIRAKAEKFVIEVETLDDAIVPERFWWARGEAALDQNWTAGDFETWINPEMRWRMGCRY